MGRCQTGLYLRNASTKAGVVVPGVILLWGLCGCAVPLLNAAASGDTKTVVQLLQNGHDANEGFPLLGTRPLMLAAANGQAETVNVLLDAGADLNAEDLTGWTALHAAAFHGSRNIVSILLQRGAVPGKTRWYIQSPTRIAEMSGHTDIAAILTKPQMPTGDDDPNAPVNTPGD